MKCWIFSKKLYFICIFIQFIFFYFSFFSNYKEIFLLTGKTNFFNLFLSLNPKFACFITKTKNFQIVWVFKDIIKVTTEIKSNLCWLKAFITINSSNYLKLFIKKTYFPRLICWNSSLIIIVYRYVIYFSFMKIKFTNYLIVINIKDPHISCFEPTNNFMFLVKYLEASNLFIKASELVDFLKKKSFIRS